MERRARGLPTTPQGLRAELRRPGSPRYGTPQAPWTVSHSVGDTPRLFVSRTKLDGPRLEEEHPTLGRFEALKAGEEDREVPGISARGWRRNLDATLATAGPCQKSHTGEREVRGPLLGLRL